MENGWPEEIPVQIRWNVREFFTAEPSKLFLGSVPPNTKLRRRVIVSGFDGASVKIGHLEVTPKTEAIGVSQQVAGQGRVALDVDWQAPAEPGVFQRQIRIQIDSTPPRDLNVDVSGYVIAPESLEPVHVNSTTRQSTE